MLRDSDFLDNGDMDNNGVADLETGQMSPEQNLEPETEECGDGGRELPSEATYNQVRANIFAKCSRSTKCTSLTGPEIERSNGNG